MSFLGDYGARGSAQLSCHVTVSGFDSQSFDDRCTILLPRCFRCCCPSPPPRRLFCFLRGVPHHSSIVADDDKQVEENSH